MKQGLALLLITLSLRATAQTSRYNLGFTLSKEQFADTISITFEKGRVILPVTIKGKQYRFLLDTGASHAVVYDDSEIGGWQQIGSIASFDAINRRQMVTMVKLPPLTLGSLTLSGCQATVQHRTVKDRAIDGIIGFDLVNKGLLMKVDTRQGVLVLTDIRNHFAQETGFDTRYSQHYHVPYIKVSPFGKYEELVMFDTGNQKLYSINKNSFDKGEKSLGNPSQIEGRSQGRHMMGYSGSEPLSEVVFLALDDLKLGHFSFHDVHTVTTWGGSSIGAAILEYGSVIFLPHKKTLRFQPYNGGTSCQVGNAQLQKVVVKSDGLPVIGLVWEHGDAYKAGFREGDIIKEVDGHPLASFDEYTRFRYVKDQVYHFTVEDKRGFRKVISSVW